MPNAAQTMRDLRAKQLKEHAKRVAETRAEIARRELEQAETEPPKESA